MAQGKKSSGGGKTTNDERHCKKAFKKHPGVSPGAHNGKSKDGYSLNPELVAARAARKAAAAGKRSKVVAA